MFAPPDNPQDAALPANTVIDFTFTLPTNMRVEVHVDAIEGESLGNLVRRIVRDYNVPVYLEASLTTAASMALERAVTHRKEGFICKDIILAATAAATTTTTAAGFEKMAPWNNNGFMAWIRFPLGGISFLGERKKDPGQWNIFFWIFT